MENKHMFTDLFQHLTTDEIETYHRTVFLNMDGEKAAQARVDYYRGQFKHMGDNVKIGRGIRIRHPESISIGNNVSIDDDCVLIGSDQGITIDDGTRIKYGVYLDTEDRNRGYIHIGKDAYIGTGCILHGHRGLEIGDYTLFAQNITITPYSHIFEDREKLIKDQGGHTGKVTIGRDCYIGMDCSILYSANVGEG